MSVRMSARRRTRPAVDRGFLSELLDPLDRLAQTIYSVLVMLTFTLAFRIFRLGGDPGQTLAAEYVNSLLLGAIGAILAWGVIDGIMHVLMEFFQRGERHRLLRDIQTAETEQDAVAVIAEELDYVLEPIAGEHERQVLYRNVFAQLRDSEPRPVGFTRADFAGGLGCVLAAIIAVLPSLVPFVLLRHDYTLAVRVSNLVSFGVLFHAGYTWGRYAGFNPWRAGLTLVFVGVLMVAIAIPLGG